MREWTVRIREAGIPCRKSLGQCFLTDPVFLDRLVDAAPLDSDTHVVEIGCGPGNLTERLARRVRFVDAWEVDSAWLEYARKHVAGPVGWHLQDGVDFEIVRPMGSPVCVSNLPYSRYLEIYLALLDAPFRWRALVLTVQDEVANKILAPPGCREYGPLAVLTASQYKAEKLFVLPRSAFYPVPNVDSVAFRLDPVAPMARNRELYPKLQSIFRLRRRKASCIGGPSFKRVGELSPEELIRLAVSD